MCVGGSLLREASVDDRLRQEGECLHDFDRFPVRSLLSDWEFEGVGEGGLFGRVVPVGGSSHGDGCRQRLPSAAEHASVAKSQMAVGGTPYKHAPKQGY